jgi:hypothetical protein
MSEIHIVVVDSGSVYIEKLNHRLHHELLCGHHYNEVIQLFNGIQRSLHLFREIENPSFLPILLRSYESLDGTRMYSGKVLSIRKYFTHGNNGPEGRLKIEADNKQLYDIPLEALAQLGM